MPPNPRMQPRGQAAATASKSVTASAMKPAAAKAKTSNSPERRESLAPKGQAQGGQAPVARRQGETRRDPTQGGGREAGPPRRLGRRISDPSL